MVDADKPFAFLGFRRDEDDDIDGFAVIPDEDSLAKWKADPKYRPEVIVGDQRSRESQPKQDELSSNVPESITDLLGRFKKSMASVHNLISFTSAISPTMAHYFIEQKLLVHAKKNLAVIEDENNTLIYALNENQIVEMRQLFDEFDTDMQGLDALPGATLLSLVATFDSYFSEIVRLFLSIHPERYTQSEKEIKLKEIFTLSSLEEVISQVIDNEIDVVMRGSHTEQVRFIESHLGISIINHYERWSNFVEIFERRNLVAHGNLIVSDIYLKNCRIVKYMGIDKVNIGQQLSLTPGYLHEAADLLSEFGILLMFVLWRKHINNSGEDAFRYMSRTCYDLIRAKRPRLAQQLLEFALYKQSRDCSDLTVRMMMINLANSYKKLNNDTKCQEVISSVDWTASGDRFQVCIAALGGDIDQVVALMPGLAASKTIQIQEFREWPIFDWVRDHPRVSETFERTYGEPMRSKVPEAATIVKTGEFDDPDAKAPDPHTFPEPTKH